MGIPYRVVLSERTIEKNSVEVVERETSETIILPMSELVAYLQNKTV